MTESLSGKTDTLVEKSYMSGVEIAMTESRKTDVTSAIIEEKKKKRKSLDLSSFSKTLDSLGKFLISKHKRQLSDDSSQAGNILPKRLVSVH